MVAQRRTTKRTRSKRPALKYFFLNGELHRKVAINRGKDTIVTWNYPRHCKMTYVYSDVIRRHEKAFYTQEVCKMLNRSRESLMKALAAGMIDTPQSTYSIDGQGSPDVIYAHMWSEKDILGVLDYFASIHQGKPRRDGQITSASDLPTPREVRAMIHDEQVLYVKQGDTFVPTWKAQDY